jgi:hypothetical protein
MNMTPPTAIQLSYIFQTNRYRPVVARNCLAVAAGISPFKGFMLDQA